MIPTILSISLDEFDVQVSSQTRTIPAAVVTDLLLHLTSDTIDVSETEICIKLGRIRVIISILMKGYILNTFRWYSFHRIWKISAITRFNAT